MSFRYQTAEKREMMGRSNNEILIASFRADELNFNWHVENVRKHQTPISVLGLLF
jgi:hypothetical protein